MPKQDIVVFDAPSNLGLKPPAEGIVPGCYKLPWALRNRKLLETIQAKDYGHLVPPRYVPQWHPGDGVRNAQAIVDYSIELATYLETIINKHQKALILGGDCSILIGIMLGLKRLGRYGLAFLDGHSDFRNQKNSPAIHAAAGEDLAIVTGRGDDRLIDIENLGPYVLDQDIHVAGVREYDEFLDELKATTMHVTTSQEALRSTPKKIANNILETVTKSTEGFWIHFDCDVIDSSEMFAVDCPEPNGLKTSFVADLLKNLFFSPKCVGLNITIYDPDLDKEGQCADRIIQCLTHALTNKTD